MHFAPTDEQRYFAETIADLGARLCGPEEVRRAWTPEASADGPGPLWRALEEVGLLSMLGGDEGSGSELELVAGFEPLGRVCAPGPIVEHAAVAVPLLAALAPELLGPPVLTASAADLVPFARGADRIVLLEEERLLLLDGDAVRSSADCSSLDRSRALVRVAGDVRAGAEVVASGAEAAALIARASDRAALATATMIVGLAARAIEMSVAYVKVREQFGVPVGSFQAVKHHLANAHIAVEFTRPVVEAAAWAMSAADPEASRLCSMAKVRANQAGRLAAKVSLQCHGAMGYTMESDLHLYLMRIWSLLNAWGGTDDHRERVSRTLLDQAVSA